MSLFIDLTGKKFGRWTVIQRIDLLPVKNIRWLCRCDCGVERPVSAPNLKTGKSTSCGCFWLEIMTKIDSGFQALLTRYKVAAAKRGLPFELSDCEFRALTQQQCHYCKEKPNQRTRGKFIYNGIDRLDNTRGYTLDNSVACCFLCNKAKGNMEYSVFITWLLRFKNEVPNAFQEK